MMIKSEYGNIFDLRGKRALITGSTQGIGYAIAKTFHEYGAEVYVHCSSDKEKAKRVAEEIGSRLWVTGDLSQTQAVREIYEKTGELDIVVSNVSVQVRKNWKEITDEEFEYQVNVNFKSTLQLMQTYIPAMEKNNWGRFLFVGSVAQYRPNPAMSVYAATKCAVQSLVSTVAKQVAKNGVTVNSILPGVIETPRNDEALSDVAYREKVLSGIPARFFGIPSDCAGAALVMCSEAGRYINGAELLIDGGMAL